MEFRDQQWMAIVAELQRLNKAIDPKDRVILMETGDSDADDENDTYPSIDWEDPDKGSKLGEICRIEDDTGLLAALKTLPDDAGLDKVLECCDRHSL